MQHAESAAPAARPILCECQSPVCPRAHAPRRDDGSTFGTALGSWRRPRAVVAVLNRPRAVRRFPRHL